MRRDIIIPLIIGMLLAICNLGQAGITSSEQKKFDDSLKRIESSQKKYQARKDAQRKKDIERAKQKRAKAEKQRAYNKIAKANREEADRKARARTDKYRGNGGCYWDEYAQQQVCE